MVTVSETLAEGEPIQQVEATDADSGSNRELTYSIVEVTILPNGLVGHNDPSVSDMTHCNHSC